MVEQIFKDILNPYMEAIGFDYLDVCFDEGGYEYRYEWEYKKDPRINVCLYASEDLEFTVGVVLANSWDGYSENLTNLNLETFKSGIQDAINKSFGYGNYEDYDKTLEKIYKKTVGKIPRKRN